MTVKRVCVFAGARPGLRPAYLQAARDLGHALVASGVGVVFGGGCTGLMAELAGATLARGGEAIGVIPEALVEREGLLTGISDLRIVSSMHERKALMASLSDAFVALPGGLGTLEEFLEVATWTQLGVHRKPCILINVGGYFSPLVEMLDVAVNEGFLGSEEREIVIQTGSVGDVIAAISRWSARIPDVGMGLEKT